MSSPPHKLAFTFTSRIYDQTEHELIDDPLRDFDLTSILPNGTIGPGCRRKPTGRPVTGKAREIEPAQLAYHVEIDHDEAQYVAHYKGIAFFDDGAATSVTNIAGFVEIEIKPGVGVGDVDTIKEQFRLRAAQNETTWVATKP